MRLVNLAPTGSRFQATPRTGFTMVELMVAMALSLFLMAILSEAFAVSMDTFRGMRAIGDMQDSLRNSLRQMRDDLASPHFEGGRKLSDNDFWMEPRREGFFYMKGSVPTSEGTDPNGLASSRAVNHVMHFAVRKQGFRPTNYFSVGPFLSPPFNPPGATTPSRYVAANNPLDAYYGAVNPQAGGAFVRTQWAEVAYLLKPMSGNPQPSTPDGAIPLYNLYRAEVLLLPYRDVTPISNVSNSITVSGQLGSTLLQHISFNSLTLANFYSPNDVAMSTTRGFNPNAATLNSSQVSLLCTNVVSFQVRLLVQQRTISQAALTLDPNIVKDPMQPTTTGLTDIQNYVFSTNPTDPAIDSAASTPPTWATPVPGTDKTQTPLPSRIMGVQIRMRIYDPASGQSRQNTIVQSL
jgi:prepilin-type N-terminal cleavage/methylation domain-containing protein